MRECGSLDWKNSVHCRYLEIHLGRKQVITKYFGSHNDSQETENTLEIIKFRKLISILLEYRVLQKISRSNLSCIIMV